MTQIPLNKLYIRGEATILRSFRIRIVITQKNQGGIGLLLLGGCLFFFFFFFFQNKIRLGFLRWASCFMVSLHQISIIMVIIIIIIISIVVLLSSIPLTGAGVQLFFFSICYVFLWFLLLNFAPRICTMVDVHRSFETI